jgi:hypothetical protein
MSASLDWKTGRNHIRLNLSVGEKFNSLLELSADDVLKHLFVERQVRHDPLQPVVFLLQLAQPLHLARQ